MNRPLLIKILYFLSAVFLGLAIGVVSYHWGYMQSAIDYKVADFSAPASVALIQGIPYLIISFIFLAAAFYLWKK